MTPIFTLPLLISLAFISTSASAHYSEARTAKPSTKNGMTIQTVPNPFTSHSTINHQSAKGTLISKVYSLNGQLQLTGNNNTIITSEKIIKQ